MSVIIINIMCHLQNFQCLIRVNQAFPELRSYLELKRNLTFLLVMGFTNYIVYCHHTMSNLTKVLYLMIGACKSSIFLISKFNAGAHCSSLKWGVPFICGLPLKETS